MGGETAASAAVQATPAPPTEQPTETLVVPDHIQLQMNLLAQEEAMLSNDPTIHPHLYGPRQRHNTNVLWNKALVTATSEEIREANRLIDVLGQPESLNAETTPNSGSSPKE